MYSNIDADDKKHITSLLNWLADEVCRAGGDGDAIWYSEYYDVKEIFEIVKEINSGWKFPWKVELNGDTIFWGEHQEGMLITNNKETFDNRPNWQQVAIAW